MIQENTKNSPNRPPIVVVLGHVDHGKTTLLDTIRKTNVVSGEHGGITQHIGAYQINVKDRLVTFIDTPGHEAFVKMRSRGAAVADIAILVVAADDSVKPQTEESIKIIKAAKTPFIVALNKIDLPTANVSKVKQDLARAGVSVEGFGGDIPVVPISAKVGTGIDDLLDMILLLYDMRPQASLPDALLEAIVIETRLDKGKGMVATVIVKLGTLEVLTSLFCEDKSIGRVRAMFDEHGKGVARALPGKPVEVLGFTSLPAVGSVISAVALAPKLFKTNVSQKETLVPDFLKPVDQQEKSKLNILLKADTAGSLEAIVESLDRRIAVVAQGVGEITQADILAAKANKAVVVGFNVKIVTSALKLAETEKVICRTYTVIYKLIEELEEAALGLVEVLRVERELGQGTIIAEFPFERERIAGTKVTSGRIARGDQVKIMRGEVEIGRAKIKSLRQGKNEVTKVEAGRDCGINFDRTIDFIIQDAIIAVTI